MASSQEISEAFEIAEPVIRERYHRLFLRARIRHRYDEDDLVQQTFFRACKARHQCQGVTVSAVVNWVLKIAANTARTAITHNRTAKRRSLDRERSLGDERQFDFSDSGDCLHHILVRSEVQRLMVCLDRLPRSWQRMIVCRFLLGMTFFEIAKELGYTEGSVRGSLGEAMARLRSELGQKSLPGFEWSEEDENACVEFSGRD